MAVLSAPTSSFAPALPQAAGPYCTLQRTGSLWQLGIEAQELITAIGQLAEQLETDDDDSRAQALAAKADATCWVIEHLRGQAACRQQQAKRLTELSRSNATRADALEDSLVVRRHRKLSHLAAEQLDESSEAAALMAEAVTGSPTTWSAGVGFGPGQVNRTRAPRVVVGL